MTAWFRRSNGLLHLFSGVVWFRSSVVVRLTARGMTCSTRGHTVPAIVALPRSSTWPLTCPTTSTLLADGLGISPRAVPPVLCRSPATKTNLYREGRSPAPGRYQSCCLMMMQMIYWEAVIRTRSLLNLESLIISDLRGPAAILVTVSSRILLIISFSGLARGRFPPSVDLPVNSQQLVGEAKEVALFASRLTLCTRNCLLDRVMAAKMTVAEKKISLSSSWMWALLLPIHAAAVAVARPPLVLSVAPVRRVASLRLVVTAHDGSVADRVELLQRLSAKPTR